ncbi:MAG: hypothetical protein AAFQ94_15685 [Bacteroidota bacterium]
MALSDQNIELIMRHIEGDLNAEEQEQYDELLESSPEFRQEALEAESVVAGIKALERQKEVEAINDIFESFEKSASVKTMEDKSDKASSDNDISNETERKRRIFDKPKLTWSLGIAASLTLIFVVLYVALIDTSKTTTSQIFADNFQPFSYVDSRESDIVPPGFTLYEDSKYQESIAELKELPMDTTHSLLQIYLASALLATGQTEEAIKELELFRPNESDQFLKQYKQWYLGLAYLKSGDTRKSKEEFESLVFSGGLYERQAQNIIDQINEIENK